MQSITRILVVEDDRDIRNDLCDLLRGRDLWVDDVADLGSAVEFLRNTGDPTFVLLDPFVTGLDERRLEELARDAAALFTIPVAIHRDENGAVRRTPAHFGFIVATVCDKVRRTEAEIAADRSRVTGRIDDSSRTPPALAKVRSLYSRLAAYRSRVGQAARERGAAEPRVSA